MRNRDKRIPSALKHGAYSTTAVLPGESQAAFEKLLRDLIAEFNPSGVVENDIVADMAHLVWRKQNLATLRIAEHAQSRRDAIRAAESYIPQKFSIPPLTGYLEESDPAEREKQIQDAKERAKDAMDQLRKELGDFYELAELGEAATLDGLKKELDIKERLDAAIAKCLKDLLLVRGVKSVAATPEATSPKRALAPPKAA